MNIKLITNINNNRVDIHDNARQIGCSILKHSSTIKRMRGCMTIPIERTMISHIKTNGEDICFYSMQQCWRFFLITVENKELVFI